MQVAGEHAHSIWANPPLVTALFHSVHKLDHTHSLDTLLQNDYC